MLRHHGQSQYKFIFHQRRNAHVAAGHHPFYVIVGGQEFSLACCEFQPRFKLERQVHITETTLTFQAHTTIHSQPEPGFAPLVDFAGKDEIKDRAQTTGLGEPRQGFHA